jgi:SpoIIAA-like
MVERMKHMPQGVIGFRVDGDVEKEDYENVFRPALQDAIDTDRPLRTLYVIEDIDDMESDALWADMKLGYDLGIKHHKEWVRSAIVTDETWIVRSMKFFGWMVPGEQRVFPIAELEAAKAWVAGTA